MVKSLSSDKSSNETDESDSDSSSERAVSQKKEEIRKMVKQIDDLPSLPVAVQRINAVMDQQKSDAEDVGKALETDPSLTAKVLKMVNSAYFGLQRRITSISDAVVYLGFKTVRNLVLNASVIRMTPSSKSLQSFAEFNFNWPDFWKKSVATGIATETVARELRVPGHKAAMPAGILHMLGILVLRSKLPMKFKKILKLSKNEDMDYFDAEKEILGTHSTEISVWLSDNWNLPKDIMTGLTNWREPLNVPEEDQLVPLLVHTGERFARARDVGWNPEGNVNLSKAIISELNITPGTFEDILNLYRRDLKDAKLFLKICEELD